MTQRAGQVELNVLLVVPLTGLAWLPQYPGRVDGLLTVATSVRLLVSEPDGRSSGRRRSRPASAIDLDTVRSVGVAGV